MKEIIDWLRESVGGKLVFVAFLVLVLLIPLGMIEVRIDERGSRADEAAIEIARAWGGRQTLGGPVLALPVEYQRTLNDKTTRTSDEIYVLPASLEIEVVAESQTLERGIYEIPVYTANVSMRGLLSPPPPNTTESERIEQWSNAMLALPVSDARAFGEAVRITIGTASAQFGPGGERIQGFGQQLMLPLAALSIESFDSPLEFSIAFRLRGTGSLGFLPLGDTTAVNVRSDWPSPSFGGAFLPDDRDVSASGFDATWGVLNLGRGYASTWNRSTTGDLTQLIQSSGFGVDLIVPVGPHETSLRATKYAVLFLALTFLAYFLFELFLPIRLHPFQYLLVGLANTLFYLLLIALAEHVGFDIAYGLSALGSTALIGGYSVAVLGAARRALSVALLLAGIYGYLYFTLQVEDFALLSGSLALFAILAAVMYLTRRIHWNDLRFAAS